MELAGSESAWSPGAQLAPDDEPVGAGPRVFEVYTPDQFRKALSSLLEEIARL